MRIGEILQRTDIDTYRKLMRIGKKQYKKNDKGIKLGDRPENLMKHDAHKRIGRRLKQIRWG